MATTTTYLGLTKPAGTEPVNIDPLNNNFDKIDAGVLRAMRGKAADNLMDNGYFSSSQVINQRSATKTTAWGYCIDRWIGRIGDIVLSFSADGLTMTSAASSNNFIYQKIRTGKGLNGKTLTVAVCDGAGEIAVRSVTLPTTNTSTWTGYGNAITSHGVYANITDTGSGDYPIVVCCGIESGKTTGTIRWVALYEGAYTADTLPDYVPKGYAAELAECQRYYWQREIDSPAVTTVYLVECCVQFPAMRVIPTIRIISANGTDGKLTNGIDGVTEVAVIITGVTTQKFLFGTPNSEFTVNMCYRGKIIVSADL